MYKVPERIYFRTIESYIGHRFNTQYASKPPKPLPVIENFYIY